MIINTGSNSSVSAEAVKYGEFSVAETLDGLKFSTNFLSDMLESTDDAVGSLVDELTANGKRIYLDYQDGQYGYNTSASRGADTFSPFKGGGEYTLLTTASVTGNKLPTVSGCGYFILRKTSITDDTELSIYVDGNSKPFYYSGANSLTLYFQESIRFSGGVSGDTYLYQTLLAEKPISKKYTILTGEAKASTVTVSGKGKILFTSGYYNSRVVLTLNQISKLELSLSGELPLEVAFDNNVSFYSWTANYPVYYIAYVEI